MNEVLAYGVIPIYFDAESFQVLIIQHQKGHWSFPKGRPEPNESSIETALRELTEETGISECQLVKDIDFVENYKVELKGKVVGKEVRFFLGIVFQTRVIIQEEELKDYLWCHADTARERITYEESRKTLEQVNAYISSNHGDLRQLAKG